MPQDICETCGDLIVRPTRHWDRDDNPLCRNCFQELEDKDEHLRYEAAWRGHIEDGGRGCR